MSLSPFEKAASGALASAVANTLVYPLDLSKTIIQTQVKRQSKDVSSGSELESVYVQKIQHHELKYKNTVDVLRKIHAKKGVLGWYHGLLSSILGSAAQNFSYFYWYTIVRQVYAQMTRRSVTAKHLTPVELFLGALAAAISQMFTMPIGVITTQQQTDKHQRLLYQLAKEIYVHDGVTGFWKGLSVSLVLCVNPSITYGSFERLKQILFPTKEYLGPLESFTIGMLAKSLATVATQPLIVSKAMLQKNTGKKGEKTAAEIDLEKADEDPKFNHFTEALAHLWNTEKFRGLYKGIAPQLLKGVIVQGMLFMFKDQIDLLFLFLLRALRDRKARLLLKG